MIGNMFVTHDGDAGIIEHIIRIGAIHASSGYLYDFSAIKEIRTNPKRTTPPAQLAHRRFAYWYYEVRAHDLEEAYLMGLFRDCASPAEKIIFTPTQYLAIHYARLDSPSQYRKRYGHIPACLSELETKRC